MSVDKVLQLLADGEVHSGEELGALLGVSRTAVWKQLQKLEAFGLKLNVVKGKGYQLANGLELLNEAVIVNGLSAQAKDLLSQFDILGSVESTNSLAMQRAQSAEAHGYICVAEHQTSGRGRMGRQWVSPYGRNIYLSAVWAFDGGVAQLEGLSLAVGVAIARALSANNISDVNLKWPNDVLCNGQKLAGVLLEMSGDPAGRCHVIIGIGLNVSMLPEEAQNIEQEWTTVAANQPAVSRNQLLSSLIENLLLMLHQYHEKGFEPYRAEWEQLDSLHQQDVEIRIGQQVIHGKAAGVAASGALRVITEQGEQLIHGGEASLRRA